VACGNPDAAAIGQLTRRLLERSGHWDALNQQVQRNGVFKPTVNDVANDVKLGSVDVGIVWDTTVAQYPELQAVPVPELGGEPATVDVAVLTATRDATAALHFARYISARDRGLEMFAQHHFAVVEGDQWADVPEITFFAGSVNRRALEPVLKAFAAREGIEINTVYNGCGILTGQMRIAAENRAGGFPDTYMACDVYYLDVVRDWFQDAVNVSDTDIVIAVQKGNPKGIRTLQDLQQPGMRVAIGQPEQCTIGVLTRRMLEHEGLYEVLLEHNVVTQTETSALLVPAVTTKSVDAALAYRTDTLAERDKIDVLTIDSQLSKAIQPYSIARSSQHKELGRRLFQAIAQSREAFEAAGFHWRLNGSSNIEH
jgi:ABC-type molybdate transport system substrate-binding protein